MQHPASFTLASLGGGSLVAPSGHRDACDGLAESLLTCVCALIVIEDEQRLLRAHHGAAVLRACQPHERVALRPVQLLDGVGYRQLSDQRELLDHRVGPWLRQEWPLPELAAATEEFDLIARAVLAALCRSSYIRLPGSALLPALDDLPLPQHAWASSSLQCLGYRAGRSGCEAHEDRSLLTLIYAPGQPGLQVRNAQGLWRFANLGRNQLLVLAGHALEYATCGLIRSSQHRVVLMGAERRSLAYKLAAQPEAVINLRPVLEAAGHKLCPASDRFPQPVTYKQLMDQFEATHHSVNPTARPAAAPAAAREPACPSARAAPAVPLAAAQPAAPVLPATPAQAAAAEDAAVPAGSRAAPAAASAAGSAPAAKRPRLQAVVPQLQQGAAPAGSLTIRLRDMRGDELSLRVTPAMQWRTAARTYCHLTGYHPDSIRFVVRGDRLGCQDTIEQSKLEDGDMVDVLDVQAGD